MTRLVDRHCVPCTGAVPPLDERRAGALLLELEGWVIVDGHHLSKSWAFPDFASALAFVNRVAAVAEDEGHHPDIQLGWGRVRIDIWTHKIDGLTESDFVLAARTDSCLEPPGPAPRAQRPKRRPTSTPRLSKKTRAGR